ncbi:MAG: bifunctional YncE family protein/alkaline phosphatase family protein, partial [Gemmatimonadetes bacterium]|nr:bifunctional YncE family protein/alkaline phosphatase family protein [Gemmatimonadota bacterium]
MLIPLAIALQARAATPPLPARVVADSGVIATDQRVTPAGVQSVFTGRVGGVRFGAGTNEIWVAAPGGAYRLNWTDNSTVAHGAYDGRAGVQGVAFDPVSGRAFVTSVGRLPAPNRLPGQAEKPGARVIAQVRAFTGSVALPAAASGPPMARLAFRSDSIGDYLAGAPSVAKRRNASGRRPLVVPLPANDRLALFDADDGAPLGGVALGVLPVASVTSDDGSAAWVSVFGGPKPTSRDRAARQCCDPRAEAVRVDARGIAERGSVVRVDLLTRRVTAQLETGLHPTGLAWDQARGLLYVVNGNSDDVTVVDTRAAQRIGTIAVAPFHERLIGLAPTAAALSPDGRTLYVTLGGINAVAVLDVSAGTAAAAKLTGLIPTGWYPTSVDVSADGTTLAVGTLLGVGSGQGTTSGHPGAKGGYVHANRGSVNVIAVPTSAQLTAYTTSVAQNNRLTLTRDAARDLAPRRDVAARAVPERPGEPSRIEHVVFIIRENRTYDQVLGALGRGKGDPSLVMYGRDVTPNTHALAEQFVTLDHFFASGGNSADGHQWLTQANETEYPYWPLYHGRSYPSEGEDPLAYSSGGFLWEAAQRLGRTVTVFGEYAPSPRNEKIEVFRAVLDEWRRRDSLPAGFFRRRFGGIYHTRSDIPSLDRALVREYPGWSMGVPDVAKAEVILEHLRDWEAAKAMPNLVMVILPNDHTMGTSEGWCAPRACVADNDLALGKIVEGLSHSSFWPKMAILVVEDDAQDAVDHIDGHRTVALVASPWARRGIVDSTFYSQPSMVKTIELMLGLPALSMYDLVATDMRASFLAPAEAPDLTPFRALVPQQRLDEYNVKVGSIAGPFAQQRRDAARASARMNFADPDAAPSDRLNRILWHDARGWGTPYPGVKRAVFFPLSI